MAITSRRSFMAASAAFSLGRVLGANDKVNIGIVGIGGRGNDHIKNYATLPNARIAALCDVNQSNLEVGQAAVKKLTNEQPTGYDDMRKLFADKSIDAVSITTPNHWHALATIWACEAGKDVYCEKPACYNPHEGERMIEVARKTGRMVQIGSQSRSLAFKMKAMQLLHEGVIGKVYMAKGLCFKRRPSIGHVADSAGSGGRELGYVPRSRAHAPLQCAALQVQLALVLGHGQWRHRQSGRARDGYRALGPGRSDVA